MIPYFMNIPERYRRAIDEFVNKARERYGGRIESIILFGSVVRGEAEGDSDIDILVVVNGDSFKMQKLISEVAVKILLKTGTYVSAKVLSREEYDFIKDINSSFYRNVSKEGIVIG